MEHMEPAPDTCSVRQKINNTKLGKRNCYIECWKCPLKSAVCAFGLLLMFGANR